MHRHLRRVGDHEQSPPVTNPEEGPMLDVITVVGELDRAGPDMDLNLVGLTEALVEIMGPRGGSG